jgi:hypothetical protein
MIVVEGSGFEKRLHANRYAPTSKQTRITPTRGSWMDLHCRDIMPLSFIKDGTDGIHVQGTMTVISLSALSKSRFFPELGSHFLYTIKYISISRLYKDRQIINKYKYS